MQIILCDYSGKYKPDLKRYFNLENFPRLNVNHSQIFLKISSKGDQFVELLHS